MRDKVIYRFIKIIQSLTWLPAGYMLYFVLLFVKLTLYSPHLNQKQIYNFYFYFKKIHLLFSHKLVNELKDLFGY